MENQKIAVALNFVNKKGEQKHVRFFMDKNTYQTLFDKSVTKEMRQQYLIDEYHEYAREKYRSKNLVSLNYETSKSPELLESLENPLESNIKKYDATLIHQEIERAIKQLTPRQQEIVRLIYWEGKTQKELCGIYGVKKQAINDALRRIHNRLRKILTKK